MTWALKIVFVLSSFVRADQALPGLLRCLQKLPRGMDTPHVRRDRGMALVAGHTPGAGWSILTFGRISARCPLPAGVQACFRSNPNCPSFEFLLARAVRSEGVGVTFDGTAIDEVSKTARLAARLRWLPRGTVDENGKISKVVRPAHLPLLGLKCWPDRDPGVTVQLERALVADLATLRVAFDRRFAPRDRRWSKAAPYLRALADCAVTPRMKEVAEGERVKFLDLVDAPATKSDVLPNSVPSAR